MEEFGWPPGVDGLSVSLDIHCLAQSKGDLCRAESMIVKPARLASLGLLPVAHLLVGNLFYAFQFGSSSFAPTAY